ncbi:MAG: hypothetical protein COS84_06210 [Armatimonadetes bacterium CG07_land_8_20_14_0_80_40_9]|nr:MAG: hypothetical protein COS84_06210 [Armatimonadetes bacterium CG07_land_8_20_14_0_80_40_9]
MMGKEEILKHIKATRLWLDKAEKWVEKNNLVRGLLVLFLASAEIQGPLKESVEERKVTPYIAGRHLNLRYLPAIGIAATFLVISFAVGYLWLNTRPSSVMVSKPEVKTITNETPKVSRQRVFPPSLVKTASVKPEVLPKVSSPRRVERVRLPARKISQPRAKEEVKVHAKLSQPSPEVMGTKKDSLAPTASDLDLLELVRIAEKTLREGGE